MVTEAKALERQSAQSELAPRPAQLCTPVCANAVADRVVQVSFALGDLLGERERKTGLHQHVETPAFNLRQLILGYVGDLRHEVSLLRFLLDEPCRSKFASPVHSVPNAPSRVDSASA